MIIQLWEEVLEASDIVQMLDVWLCGFAPFFSGMYMFTHHCLTSAQSGGYRRWASWIFFPKNLSANTHDVSNTICYTYITPLCHIGYKKVPSSTYIGEPNIVKRKLARNKYPLLILYAKFVLKNISQHKQTQYISAIKYIL